MPATTARRLLLPLPPPPVPQGGNWFNDAAALVTSIVEEGSKTVVHNAEALWNTSPHDQGALLTTSPGTPVEVMWNPSSCDNGTPRSCLRSPTSPGWHDYASSAPFPRTSSTSSSSSTCSGRSVHFSPGSSIAFSASSPPSSLRSPSLQAGLPPSASPPCITLNARCKSLKRLPLHPPLPPRSSSLPGNASKSSRNPAARSSSPLVANASH
ncbi:hypothetical protein T484DRAFT_1989675 [Baffinella frigidus]|nr:hypothetical protein T484DRAFT_1989675 [Cryptophyta sp. CCMP2293]|mmetsp:Transcript_32251/g.76650  ORF Transcript_32251/g.76650 Transcript_32251/m.76650 type:complete len:211 (-) Transcript_32251:18-650(-)